MAFEKSMVKNPVSKAKASQRDKDGPTRSATCGVLAGVHRSRFSPKQASGDETGVVGTGRVACFATFPDGSPKREVRRSDADESLTASLQRRLVGLALGNISNCCAPWVRGQAPLLELGGVKGRLVRSRAKIRPLLYIAASEPHGERLPPLANPEVEEKGESLESLKETLLKLISGSL
jgi:hypothetical protein